MANESTHIAILGGGRMGEAIVAGLLQAGRTPGDVVVAERHGERAAALAVQYGVEIRDNVAAVQGAQIVMLAVKPQDMAVLLEEIGSFVAPTTLVVTVAAGLPIAFFEKVLPDGTPVVRVMPNTPLLVGEGMSALAGGTYATAAHLAAVEGMLQPVGHTVRVTEDQLDAVTAVSGSGPAYFFLVVEVMVEAAQELGLTRDMAIELVVQTAVGAGAMLRGTTQTPAELREAVTSKGGTTAAALRVLEGAGVRTSFMQAMTAAAQRSQELGDELTR
jgi:pyrroline-5-carboxylate reductase